ncbi:MAG TPA: M1 family metallopeptidase [Flavobacterium sp.]|jgi:aminopeptidase N
MKNLFHLLLLISILVSAQQTKLVDFKTVHGNVIIDPLTRTVSGTVTYEFEVLSKIDTIRVDAINMSFTDVAINNKSVPYKSSAKALALYKGFKKGKNRLRFKYSAQPGQTMYFIGNGADAQVWTQGQGKYTSHWFPSFDDTNEKVIFNMSVTYGKEATVISNGVLKNKQPLGPKQQWNFEMKNPMSSYLLMIVIGDFDVRTVQTTANIPLELYIQRQDANKWEPTYRYSRQIFDFLNAEIDVQYPWEVYKQVPVRDFLYAGMENTSATIFARDYVVDSVGFNDRNYVNVNAHELAHQWFGDMVTSKSGEHHWLQEGFATYYALLAERSIFGDDYFYMRMYDMAENLQRAATTDTIPVQNAKASSLTFYQKGAWALHVLREGVGEQAFKKAVKNYLQKYKFKNVETVDFLAEINAQSGFDTQKFSEKWLEKPGFEVEEALRLLSKNQTMKNYFAIADMGDKPYAVKQTMFEDLMKADASDAIREEILFQTHEVPLEEKQELVRLAMQSRSIKVRQMLAKTLKDFPVSFEPQFETLLDDASYITQEIVMNVIWSQFPERRHAILNKTVGSIGFNDKNLRILWLTLALATTDYQPQNKTTYYDELLKYASGVYDSNVRINAIESLLFIDKNDSNVLKDIVNLTTHHKWQATQFAREKIRLLLKSKSHRTYFETLLPQVSKTEYVQLSRLLNE